MTNEHEGRLASEASTRRIVVVSVLFMSFLIVVTLVVVPIVAPMLNSQCIGIYSIDDLTRTIATTVVGTFLGAIVVYFFPSRRRAE
jgi:hypothetical protein